MKYICYLNIFISFRFFIKVSSHGMSLEIRSTWKRAWKMKIVKVFHKNDLSDQPKQFKIFIEKFLLLNKKKSWTQVLHILFFGVWHVKSCFLDQRDKFCRSAAMCRQILVRKTWLSLKKWLKMNLNKSYLVPAW